ncbi:MAG: winged helix-turn-helix transcriptional regulator [Alphaproteobacteria bacterium]
MTQTNVPASRRAAEDAARFREIFEHIERSDAVNQRGLAAELGVALGLVNAYVARAVDKGWVKVQHIPARRYRYYLTPKGFAEKSRLTLQYLNDSFVALRRARASFERLYDALAKEGVRRVALAGDDDLVDIAVLAALGGPVEVVGVANPLGPARRTRGVPVVEPGAGIAEVWVIASTKRAREVRAALSSVVPGARIVAPDVLPR